MLVSPTYLRVYLYKNISDHVSHRMICVLFRCHFPFFEAFVLRFFTAFGNFTLRFSRCASFTMRLCS
jgi:hypothetical protein